jgi:hypothetical protein
VTGENPFSPAKLAAMREEILRDGLLVDKFLGSDPDVLTFGLNLACAWPFPDAWRGSYEQMARKLSALGPEVYVYPFPCTHITLVTLINFARHIRPPTELAESLKGKIPEIMATLSPLFARNSTVQIRPFTLQPQSPVLARGAGLLPMHNPDGEVARLRRRLVEVLQANEPLHRELMEHGFNVPGIIHSTVLRFVRPPTDLEKFLARFGQIAAETKFPPMEVKEIVLTSETKPYMRNGEVLRRFKSVANSP